VQRKRNAVQRGQEGHDDRPADSPDRQNVDERRQDGHPTGLDAEAASAEVASHRQQGAGGEGLGLSADEAQPGSELDDDGPEGPDDRGRGWGWAIGDHLALLSLYILEHNNRALIRLISGMGACICPEDGYLYEEGRRDLREGRQDLEMGRMELNAGRYDIQEGERLKQIALR